MKAEKPRQIAARIVQRASSGEMFLENALEAELRQGEISPVDRGLIQELAYGVVRWQSTLDWLIAEKTQGRKQVAGLQVLLRLGLYQLFWLSRIPDHAAVNETVEMAKSSGFGAQAGFVNALLRNYLREREATVVRLEELKRTVPPVGYSHPEWLWTRWCNRWGDEAVRQLLEWNNRPAPVYARVNRLRADAEILTRQWQIEGVEYRAAEWDWTGANNIFQLLAHPPLHGLLSFQHGWFYVQDPSTLLAVKELAAAPGEKVLDLCAAPGGKTTLIAQDLQNRGLIVAQDIDAGRRELVAGNCQRLGVTCVRVTRGDAGHPGHTEPFDRVLVDAPCSNTGVMRRRVELRWRIKPESFEPLRRTQAMLLTQAASLLKRQGTMVYSTCSLEPEENQEMTQAFLQSHPQFRLEAERMLLPFSEGVDGAYVARFVASGR